MFLREGPVQTRGPPIQSSLPSAPRTHSLTKKDAGQNHSLLCPPVSQGEVDGPGIEKRLLIHGEGRNIVVGGPEALLRLREIAPSRAAHKHGLLRRGGIIFASAVSRASRASRAAWALCVR